MFQWNCDKDTVPNEILIKHYYADNEKKKTSKQAFFSLSSKEVFINIVFFHWLYSPPVKEDILKGS